MPSRKLTRIVKDLDGIWLQTARFRPIFASVLDGNDTIEILIPRDSDAEFQVANGGAVLTAYNKLMFCDDGSQQGSLKEGALREALLRYCELDTMSMVFIWEYFKEECKIP